MPLTSRPAIDAERLETVLTKAFTAPVVISLNQNEIVMAGGTFHLAMTERSARLLIHHIERKLAGFSRSSPEPR